MTDVVYTKPTTLIDMEERLAGEKNLPVATARVMVVEGNELDNFVGVDPIYRNYATDIGKPYAAEGAEGEYEARAKESSDAIISGRKDETPAGEPLQPEAVGFEDPAPEKPAAKTTK
jgi:hypothetical protein